MTLQVLETGKGPGASLAEIGLGAHGCSWLMAPGAWLRMMTFPFLERWQVEKIGEGSSNSAVACIKSRPARDRHKIRRVDMST
jgi:hypothetical protein